MKIFGREPALVVGLIGSALTTAAALGVPHISAGAAAAITAFLSSVLIAVSTRPAAPALFTGIVAAGAALLTEYGVHASDAAVAAVSGTVLAVLAFVTRGQVEPSASPARVAAPR